ncbi:MAG: hypothetical protein GEV05_15415 [Betaproteobacteria bacterium]|nr:hypothetical protein [Betaproteobacteria bacterium]
MLRAAALTESEGIPSASIIGSGFVRQAELVMRGLGLPLGMGVYPGAPMLDSEPELQRKVNESLGPGLLAALTTRTAIQDESVREPAPGDVVFDGSFDEIQEHFHRNRWTDGLPIVPPTPSRVAAFLSFTARASDEVLRIVPQESREATIHSIAVNGVMAGCRPEYMPLLIAIVEALCDPHFRLEDAGSTPGWEPLVIVSGPIARELDFNYGQGVLRVGRRANTSVGRFVRLYLRNVCGYRIPPGSGDKASIGQSFLVALAEDEACARAIGWPTFAMERGFSHQDNVVTVQSIVAMTSPLYSSGAAAEEHVRHWADVMAQSFAYWSHNGFKRGGWYPLIVAGPGIAEVIAGEWSKDDIRRCLQQNMRVTVDRILHYARMTSTPTFSFEQLVREGVLPPHYAESDDPKRLVPMIIDPDTIGILVAGDPDRNQSRCYMSNHLQGAPVSRRVALPAGWRAT